MSPPSSQPQAQDKLVCYYWSDDLIRSRSVSTVLLSATLGIPGPPVPLTADWERDIAQQLELQAGDVEPLSLARTRMHWPDYRLCVQAVANWAGSLGLQEPLAAADIALMACRGAKYHHDGAQYGGMAFCNLFLSEDKGLDLHFPSAGRRIPLSRGTLVIFDTCQPHAVIPRGSSHFDAANFPPGRDCSEVFLSWELPIEHGQVARALGVTFDTDPATAAQLHEAQLRRNGAPASVSAEAGHWGR